MNSKQQTDKWTEKLGYFFCFGWTMEAQRWYANQAEKHGCNLLPKENC